VDVQALCVTMDIQAPIMATVLTQTPTPSYTVAPLVPVGTPLVAAPAGATTTTVRRPAVLLQSGMPGSPARPMMSATPGSPLRPLLSSTSCPALAVRGPTPPAGGLNTPEMSRGSPIDSPHMGGHGLRAPSADAMDLMEIARGRRSGSCRATPVTSPATRTRTVNADASAWVASSFQVATGVHSSPSPARSPITASRFLPPSGTLPFASPNSNYQWVQAMPAGVRQQTSPVTAATSSPLTSQFPAALQGTVYRTDSRTPRIGPPARLRGNTPRRG